VHTGATLYSNPKKLKQLQTEKVQRLRPLRIKSIALDAIDLLTVLDVDGAPQKKKGNVTFEDNPTCLVEYLIAHTA
jgi:hypothetical protein